MPHPSKAQPSTAQPAVAAQHGPSLVRGLSLTDSVMLLAGGIIGSGIFLTAGPIASAVRTPLFFLGVWLAGGLISLLACFAFAEMGAMFPEAGGQYVYLREAYGEFPAFLYGWMIFTVGQSGTIAALAVGFAEYFGAVLPFASAHVPVATILGWTLTRGHVISICSIVLLTAINVLGLKRGSALINVATWAKFAAIGLFIVLGLAIGHGHWSNYAVSIPASQPMSLGAMISGFGVALIGVFWAFDGWVYITWVAGEIKNPQRVLPRAMVMGVLVVGVIYLAVNAVYLYALPITAVAKEETVAHAAAAVLVRRQCRALAQRGDRTLVLRSDVVRHPQQRAGFVCHGARRRLLSCHGARASALPHARLQPDFAERVGGGAGPQRQLRSALHLRDVHDGAVVHGGGGGIVRAAAHPPRPAASVSLHRLSLFARALRAGGGRLGAQLGGHASQRNADRHRDCLSRRAVLCVLALAVEAEAGRIEGV